MIIKYIYYKLIQKYIVIKSFSRTGNLNSLQGINH